MAGVKQAAKATETEETKNMINNTMKEKKADAGADSEAVDAKETDAEEEKLTLIYIGPPLPAGKLKTNKIMIGTMEEIRKEMKEILEEYPLVEKMFVPIEKLAEKKAKARTAGNILNKYYTDIVSSIEANEEAKEG